MKPGWINNTCRWVIPIALYLLLAFDGNTHWDENNYLYKSAFVPIDLDAGWLAGFFYRSRLGHILVLKALFAIFGKGIPGLFLVEGTMAAMTLISGYLCYRSAVEVFGRRANLFPVFLVFIFSPAGLYFGYKSLAETTALFFTSCSLYAFVRALGKSLKDSLFGLIASGALLFLAANCREASLLGFFSVAIPAVLLFAQDIKGGIIKLVFAYGCWLIIFVGFGLAFDVWATSRVVEGLTPAQMARDAAEYPSNLVGIAKFGGIFWLFALIALGKWREKSTQAAILTLALSLIPLGVYANHIELRYLGSALWGFSLLGGIGLAVVFEFAGKLGNPRRAATGIWATLVMAIGLNRLIMPLTEYGTTGAQLIRLVQRVKLRYPDPLLIMNHPHTTYAFLRIAYPEARIALCRDWDVEIPLVVGSIEELKSAGKPWLYLWPRGGKDRPLVIRLLSCFESGEPLPAVERKIAGSSWVDNAPGIRLEEVDREGQYVVYQLELASDG